MWIGTSGEGTDRSSTVRRPGKPNSHQLQKKRILCSTLLAFVFKGQNSDTEAFPPLRVVFTERFLPIVFTEFLRNKTGLHKNLEEQEKTDVFTFIYLP